MALDRAADKAMAEAMVDRAMAMAKVMEMGKDMVAAAVADTRIQTNHFISSFLQGEPSRAMSLLNCILGQSS